MPVALIVFLVVYSDPTLSWPTYKDDFIKGVQFKYDPSFWTLKKTDIRECRMKEPCGPVYGRRIDLISKKYGNDLLLNMAFIYDPKYVLTTNNPPICYDALYFQDIGSGEYRVKTDVWGQSLGQTYFWDEFYLHKNLFTKGLINNCLHGGTGLSYKLPSVYYKKMPVYFSTDLTNRVSSSFESVGDETVKSVR